MIAERLRQLIPDGDASQAEISEAKALEPKASKRKASKRKASKRKASKRKASAAEVYKRNVPEPDAFDLITSEPANPGPITTKEITDDPVTIVSLKLDFSKFGSLSELLTSEHLVSEPVLSDTIASESATSELITVRSMEFEFPTLEPLLSELLISEPFASDSSASGPLASGPFASKSTMPESATSETLPPKAKKQLPGAIERLERYHKARGWREAAAGKHPVCDCCLRERFWTPRKLDLELVDKRYASACEAADLLGFNISRHDEVILRSIFTDDPALLRHVFTAEIQHRYRAATSAEEVRKFRAALEFLGNWEPGT